MWFMNIGYTKESNPFIDMALFSNVFEPTHTISRDLRKRSERLASCWYTFSEFMPWYLSHQASVVSTNQLRFSFIQIAHEELGEGNRLMVHSDKFLEAVLNTGLDVDKDLSLESINWLKLNLVPDDDHILGLSLGLEVIANENISTLLNLIGYTTEIKNKLASSFFFATHFINEDQHILINSNNYLRFCENEKNKESFMDGYLTGLEFWEKFWMEAINE